MRPQFPLFQSHLDLAHHYWKTLLKSGDIAIDATCGNGNDTLALAKLVLNESQGKVYGFDLQQSAIENTCNLLKAHLPESLLSKIRLLQQSHEVFPKDIPPASVKIIVYNLGYLPKGDKAITTKTPSTLLSVQNALSLIQPSGVICITCYPGHAEGAVEEEYLIKFAESLDPQIWNCTHQRTLNRTKAPSMIVIQKAH